MCGWPRSFRHRNGEKLKTVDPDPQIFSEVLKTLPPGLPLVMINLLKFRKNAAYPKGVEAEPCTGREAYQRYAAVAVEKVLAVGGRPLWMGKCERSLIGPAEECWDEMLLVKYPSKEAFLKMVAMPDYQRAAIHRTAALEDSRLIPTRETAQF
jgi:uncharacterized protein (DUF1330 family)